MKAEEYLDRLEKYANDSNSPVDLAICILLKPRLLKEDNDTPPLDSSIRFYLEKVDPDRFHKMIRAGAFFTDDGNIDMAIWHLLSASGKALNLLVEMRRTKEILCI